MDIGGGPIEPAGAARDIGGGTSGCAPEGAWACKATGAGGSGDGDGANAAPAGGCCKGPGIEACAETDAVEAAAACAAASCISVRVLLRLLVVAPGDAAVAVPLSSDAGADTAENVGVTAAAAASPPAAPPLSVFMPTGTGDGAPPPFGGRCSCCGPAGSSTSMDSPPPPPLVPCWLLFAASAPAPGPAISSERVDSSFALLLTQQSNAPAPNLSVRMSATAPLLTSP